MKLDFDRCFIYLTNKFKDFLKGLLMAKKNVVLIGLVSSAGTGTFFVKKRTKKLPNKLSFKKYDPVVRKHVVFTEKKL